MVLRKQRNSPVFGHDGVHGPGREFQGRISPGKRLAPAHGTTSNSYHMNSGLVQRLKRGKRLGRDGAPLGERVVDVGEHGAHRASGGGVERGEGLHSGMGANSARDGQPTRCDAAAGASHA